MRSESPSSDAESLASRLLRVVPALRSHELRLAFVRDILVRSSSEQLRLAFDEIWMASDAGQRSARDVMLAVVSLAVEPQIRQILASMGTGFLGQQSEAPPAGLKAKDVDAVDDARKVPDYGAGRPLTLGERKALARKPDRRFMQRLILDPNASVIRNLLANPKLTEDDVVSLAVRRPLPESLVEELLRHAKWSTRRRVRMAIVLNPSCPTSIGLAIIFSLMRSELRVLAQSMEVTKELRVLASSRLQFLSRHRKPVD